MKNTRLVGVVLFILLFLCGYVIMGYTRHEIYEERKEDYISEFIAYMEEDFQKLTEGEDHFYVGSPEAARIIEDPVFRDYVNSLYSDVDVYNFEYRAEVLPQLVKGYDNQRWNLWGAYKGWVIYYYQLMGIHGAAGSIFIGLGPNHSDDWCGLLAESIALWEASGGNREGDWMEAYMHSLQYQQWLTTILTGIENPRGTRLLEALSIEGYYNRNAQPLDLPFWTTVFCRDLLGAEQKMLDITYDRYIHNVAEKDIIRAETDAWIVRSGGSLIESASERNFDALYILRSRMFPFRDLTVDLCIIFAFSTLLTVIIMRKVLPKYESANEHG
jgi:hypothetical protein